MANPVIRHVERRHETVCQDSAERTRNITRGVAKKPRISVTTFGYPCVSYFIILTTDYQLSQIQEAYDQLTLIIAGQSVILSDWMLLIQCNMIKDKVDWTPKYLGLNPKKEKPSTLYF